MAVVWRVMGTHCQLFFSQVVAAHVAAHGNNCVCRDISVLCPLFQFVFLLSTWSHLLLQRSANSSGRQPQTSAQQRPTSARPRKPRPRCRPCRVPCHRDPEGVRHHSWIRPVLRWSYVIAWLLPCVMIPPPYKAQDRWISDKIPKRFCPKQGGGTHTTKTPRMYFRDFFFREVLSPKMVAFGCDCSIS